MSIQARTALSRHSNPNDTTMIMLGSTFNNNAVGPI
jgi:hypothetical protein